MSYKFAISSTALLVSAFTFASPALAATYKCEAGFGSGTIGSTVTADSASDAEAAFRKYLREKGISFNGVSCRKQ